MDKILFFIIFCVTIKQINSPSLIVRFTPSSQAGGNYMQGAHIGSFEVPVQFIIMAPYVLTVVLLAGFIGKSIPPRASGIPYTKDR